MAERKQNRAGVFVGLGGATLALCLLLAGRRGGGQRGNGSTGAGTGLPPDVQPSAEVTVWLRSGDRIELDGVASNLASTVIRARAVGRANVHATGDARAGWIAEVINALRAAHVTVWADTSLLDDADVLPGHELRNAAPRPRGGKLPRYDARKGLWRGGDSRTLYAFINPQTERTWVVPGQSEMLYGPQVTVRMATRDEAEELWQRPLDPGWTVASSPPRNAARRMPARPSIARDTKIELSSTSGYPFTVVLRPAKVRTSYEGSSGGTRMVTLAQRSDEAWLVLTKSGSYVGLLEESTGPEPWTVSHLANATNAIGDSGVRVRSHLLSGVTWQEAVAEGARVWWAP